MSQKNKYLGHVFRQATLALLMMFNPVGNVVQANNTKSSKKATVTTVSDNDKILKPMKINTQADIEKLFDSALQIIFAELILEEVPVPYAYSDGGRVKQKSTVGVGSTFAPVRISDYNKPNAEWYYIAINPNTFWTRKYSYEDMLKLVIGWGRYRNTTQNNTKKFSKHETVLNKMFTQLQGISLTPNEFAALYCAVYNCESNVTKLLPLIKQNIDDKIVCANHIRVWWNKVPHNDGTKARCLFEAFVFLDKNDFCGAMLNMQSYPYQTKQNTWTGASCIYADKAVKYCSTIFTSKNCMTISCACEESYLKQLYNKGITPTMAMTSLDKYFPLKVTPKTNNNVAQLRTDYEKAIKMYNAGNYAGALELFKSIEMRDGEGPDLWNDMAITYYNLKQYDNCISMCKKILKTSKYDEYAKACFNAGRAYEAKGMFADAKQNYENALEYYGRPGYGIANESSNVNYQEIYKKAIDRVSTATKTKKSNSNTKKSQSKKKSSNGAPLSPVFFFGIGTERINRRMRKRIKKSISKNVIKHILEKRRRH